MRFLNSLAVNQLSEIQLEFMPLLLRLYSKNSKIINFK